MIDNSLPFNKAFNITRIEYLILNLYDNPDNIFKAICQLIDEHEIAAMNDTMTYFYELLSFKGYPEYAEEFAAKYSIQTSNN
jgi:hypothetical protein